MRLTCWLCVWGAQVFFWILCCTTTARLNADRRSALCFGSIKQKRAKTQSDTKTSNCATEIQIKMNVLLKLCSLFTEQVHHNVIISLF